MLHSSDWCTVKVHCNNCKHCYTLLDAFCSMTIKARTGFCRCMHAPAGARDAVLSGGFGNLTRLYLL